MTPANDNSTATWSSFWSEEASGNIASKPAKRLDAAPQEVQERRLKRQPAQVFDTSALPLFGDQRHQLELF